jgi:predicted metal-dependent TIM-barrel fold hydrolase
MPKVKKVVLDNQTQEALWHLLHDENEVVAEVFGTEVKLTVLPDHSDFASVVEVIAEIEADPELQQMLLAADEDIKAGRVYSTEDAIHYLRERQTK